LVTRAPVLLLLSLAPSCTLAASDVPHLAPAARCAGEYADFLTSLLPEIRAFEASPQADYTYCIRTVATYEHLSFGRGGALRRQYVRHVRHGTGFAYAKQDGTWLVATNHHVAEHPDVTGPDGEVEGVPDGSRKVREVSWIVKSESDDAPDPVPLSKVASDEALDLAVLGSHRALRLMPYRIGRSSAVRTGNAVHVRGYPLGAFPAANTGKVIGLGQLDREGDWSHEDFVVDALLNAGNSGSPVLAVSCRTGELELVGIYHAGYRDAQALNLVVAIDQARGLLESPQTWRPHPKSSQSATAPDRAAALASLRRAPAPFLMPFGDRVVRASPEAEGVRFSLLGPDYPLSATVTMGIVDHPTGGSPAGLLLPSLLGDRALPWPSLDPIAREQAEELRRALWAQLSTVLTYRDVASSARSAPSSRARLSELGASLAGRRAEQREILEDLESASDDLIQQPRPQSPRPVSVEDRSAAPRAGPGPTSP
jgi:serine protease Do